MPPRVDNNYYQLLMLPNQLSSSTWTTLLLEEGLWTVWTVYGQFGQCMDSLDSVVVPAALGTTGISPP